MITMNGTIFEEVKIILIFCGTKYIQKLSHPNSINVKSLLNDKMLM